MDDCRSEESVPGEPGTFAVIKEAVSANRTPRTDRYDTREGDVIQGLRSGLAFSLAIWAVLLTIGALVLN